VDERRRGTRHVRRGNPLTWSRSARVLLVVVVVLGALGIFAAHRFISGGWLYFPAYTDAILAEGLDRLWSVGALAWGLVALAAIGCQRWAPESRVLVHVVIQLYALTIAFFVISTGPFSAAGWMFFLAGAVLGLLLFGAGPAAAGLVTYFGLLLLGLILGATGHLGALPEGTRPPGVSAEDWRDLTARTIVSTAIFAGLVLGLCIYLIKLLRDREQKLERLTKTDALTGVLNRGYLLRTSRAELARARRYGTALACVMLDLDHFKQVNDEHGHLVGDRVLERVGEALLATVREHDLVGRFGGEEFVLVLPNTDLEGARDLAERCRLQLAERPIDTGNGGLTVTASFGVSAYPEIDAGGIDDLLRAADAALYRAKQSGRNRVEVAA
jgi:diguanylate cyclase (GGDEF)-like protein